MDFENNLYYRPWFLTKEWKNERKKEGREERKKESKKKKEEKEERKEKFYKENVLFLQDQRACKRLIK